MQTPSSAQAKLIEQMNAGSRLTLDPKSGRYTLRGMDGKVCQIDQRPVLAMIKSGLLFQTVWGECQIA